MTQHTDAERAAFEAWAISEFISVKRSLDGSDGYFDGDSHIAWKAWQAARRAPVAPVQPIPGWQLVPVEPTAEWVDALSERGMRIGTLRNAIADMLAAAPKAAPTDHLRDAAIMTNPTPHGQVPEALQPDTALLVARNCRETGSDPSCPFFACVQLMDAAYVLERLHAENATLQQGYDAARLEIDSLQARVQELGAMLRENRSKRIVELEAKLAEAQKDAARLDYVATGKVTVSRDNGGFQLAWYDHNSQKLKWQNSWHETARAAIDAALAAEERAHGITDD